MGASHRQGGEGHFVTDPISPCRLGLLLRVSQLSLTHRALPGIVNEQMRQHLGVYVASTADSPVFTRKTGRPLRRRDLSESWKAACAAVGVEGAHVHDLRHHGATMVEGGADIRYVAEMLGHANLDTTQRYTRVSIERLRTVHATCHPAAGLNVAMASELCTALPNGRSSTATRKTPPPSPTSHDGRDVVWDNVP